MRLAPISALACLLAAVVAQTSTGPNPPTVSSGFTVTAGQPATLTWTPTTSGPVTLTLRSGAASDLNTGTVIASGIPNSGKYTFTLPADTTRNSDYTIEISSDTDSSQVNYTPQFVLESKNTVESITSSASASATSATSAASSATAASTASSAATKTSASTVSAKSASSASSATSSATSSSASGASSASTEAAPAPSTGAGTRNSLSVQAGFAAVLLGAVAVY
ncbi:hypothetical protein JMJ35_006373 [Cladonia borealis]|uniref:Yeast cell wall synthesis Kre9/Knh1-like N-terminal domain-containing protein n=1 Tax=Cladonia borealis TaxID=184061 RepID=A0AA39U8X5_9LECA|nr:hypothetical protein JMJ35_006373 [Cladonia borealis]